MKRTLSILSLLVLGCLCAQETQIAIWDFTKGVPSGEYGGVLRACGRIADGGLVNDIQGDTAAGFVTQKVHPELIPQQGFRYTAELTTGKGTLPGEKNLRCMLVDNMNVNYKHDNALYNKGIMFWLEWQPARKQYVLSAALGFGEESEVFRGSALPVNHACTVALAFNGIDKMWFEVDGKPENKQTVAHRRAVSATRIKTHIGDRMNSVHCPFDGVIAKVTLTAFPREILACSFGRLAFLRNESNARLHIRLHNSDDKVLSIKKICLQYDGRTVEIKDKAIAADDTLDVGVPIETRLKVGKYPIEVTVDYLCDGRECRQRLTEELLLSPIRHDRLPVIMMSYRSGFPEERLTDIGFNIGCRGGFTAPYLRGVPRANEASMREISNLDRMLFLGFDAMDYTNTNNYVRDKFPRINKEGKPYEPIVQADASNPDANAFIKKAVTDAVMPLVEHPAFVGMKINSEVRDACRPSFTPLMTDAYKSATGCDIPDKVEERCPPNYQQLDDFPFSRIIPMDYPLFKFYRWWWKEGDGWNNMTGMISDCVKAIAGRPLITSHDPAVRVPPLWGDGGSVGYLGHWTYAYPDAINVGINTDEMQAMAKGNPSQGIFNETQIICYRSKTAPVDEKIENPPAWALEFPNAPYITIPPDILRTAAWTQISRHVSGIMFHGYCSLLVDEPRKGDTGYQCTNLESAGVLKEILHSVVKPMGPVLKRLPEPPAQIGVLESLAPVLFSGRGSWGWSRGWIFNLNLMLQHANLQPKILYDEEIQRDGFGSLKVLFMPHCDVLAEPIYKAVTEFQLKGGIIVADSALIPGITPDIVIDVVEDVADPVAFNETICKGALELREKLRGFVMPMVETTTPELTTHYRQDGPAIYLFAINGKRTFGDYFGPWKHVCEKGMPLQAGLDIRCKAGAVYDLVSHTPVSFTSYKEHTHLDLEYETTGGKLFLFLPSPIAKVMLVTPANAELGQPFVFSARVYDANGKRMECLLPLEITVESPDGKIDDCCYGTLLNSQYSQTVIPPLNASAGAWRVTVKELASGKSATGIVAVK